MYTAASTKDDTSDFYCAAMPVAVDGIFPREGLAMTFLTAAVLLLLLMRLCMVGVLPTTKGVWRTGGLC